jgi:DNA-binding NtrC family response regulator
MEDKKPLLIVDDEKDILTPLNNLLAKKYEVHLADNGRQSLSIYGQICHNSDLIVLLDLKLPDLDGIEVLKRMLEMSRVPNIIIMTAHSDIPTAVLALQAGAYDFLLKPLDENKLNESLQKAHELSDFRRKYKNMKENFVFEKISSLYRHYRLNAERIKAKMGNSHDFDLYEKFAAFTIEFKNEVELEKTLLKESNFETRKFVEEKKIAKLSILIVEDEDYAREGLVRIFEKEYQAKSAGTGEEALNHIKNTSFDIVLLDINLPDANGIELLKEIKTAQPNADVIMTTGIDELDTAVTAIKLGASDYLIKPLDYSILIQKIKALKEKRYYEFALEYLMDDLQKEKLSFEKRKALLKEFHEEQNKKDKQITVGDIYTFLPEILSFTAEADFGILNMPVSKNEPLDTAIEKIKRLNEEMLEKIEDNYLARFKEAKD